MNAASHRRDRIGSNQLREKLKENPAQIHPVAFVAESLVAISTAKAVRPGEHCWQNQRRV